MPCAAAASPGARGRRASLGRVVGARGRQQRVDARAVHVLGQRARVLPRDRGDDVPRAVRAQLGAQHDDARATGRSRAVRRGARPRAGRGRAATAAPPGTSRAGSARPRPWPPRRRPRSATRPPPGAGSPRRRAPGGARRQQRDDPDDVVAGRDRRLGHERRRHLDGPVLHAVGGEAAQRARARVPRRGRAPTATPSRGTTIATGPPAASVASSATRLRPSPPSTASTMLQVDARAAARRASAATARTPAGGRSPVVAPTPGS